jgi:hypothetical protein
MSRYYGSLQGDRGDTTRTGHHGISAHVRGWNYGVRTSITREVEHDRIRVEMTGGSHDVRLNNDQRGYIELLRAPDGSVRVIDADGILDALPTHQDA